MESAWPSMPSFKIDILWPDFLKTHLRGDSPMDTTLSIKVPGTVVPYVIYLASKNCIILRAGLSIFKNTMVQIQHISIYNSLHFVYI